MRKNFPRKRSNEETEDRIKTRTFCFIVVCVGLAGDCVAEECGAVDLTLLYLIPELSLPVVVIQHG